MQITVFGASGKVGRIVVELLLQQGHSVIGFVHSRNPFDEHKNLRIITGDTADKQFVLTALQGSAAAVSCLGSWGTPTKDILTKSMNSIVPAMEQLGPKRLISLTGAAAFMPDEQVSFLDKANRAVLKLLQPRILADGEAHAKLLQVSKLDWTIVRSPIMIKRTASRYQLSVELPAPWATISYRAVAAAMVDQLSDTKFLCAAPAIHQK